MSTFNEKIASARQIHNDVPDNFEEIVNRCADLQRRKTALQLFSLMRVQISRHYCDNFLNNCSMKDLWLIYLMAAAYKLRWNEDKKTWIGLE